MSSIPFSDWENPTFIWIAILSIRFMSVLLSAYSTFTPLFDDFKMRNYIKFKRRATFRFQLLKMIQILLHIFFGTAMVYLVSLLKKNEQEESSWKTCPFFIILKMTLKNRFLMIAIGAAKNLNWLMGIIHNLNLVIPNLKNISYILN